MKHLFKSLSAFQQECPVIHKATQGYSYSYADLPSIFQVINPILKKHGLGFTQLIVGESIKTVVFHIESGESVESFINIPQGVQLKGMNDFQVLGSAITYLRRYSLSSALGIITDKDTDAAGEQVDEKPWLNESSPAWENVLKSLKSGYTVEDVKKKYKLSKAIEAKLHGAV